MLKYVVCFVANALSVQLLLIIMMMIIIVTVIIIVVHWLYAWKAKPFFHLYVDMSLFVHKIKVTASLNL